MTDFTPLVMSPRFWAAMNRLLDDAEIRATMAARHALCVLCAAVTLRPDGAVALCPDHERTHEIIDVLTLPSGLPPERARIGWLVVRTAR